MKVIIVNQEIEGELYYGYFLGMSSNGKILTTANLESARKYKNTKGAQIARGHIKKWGHDCSLILIRDISDYE